MPAVEVSTTRGTRRAHGLIHNLAHPSHHDPDVDSNNINRSGSSSEPDDNKNITNSRQLNGSLSRKKKHSEDNDSLESDSSTERPFKHRRVSVQVESVIGHKGRRNGELSKHSSDTDMINSQTNQSKGNLGDHQENIAATNKLLSRQLSGNTYTIVASDARKPTSSAKRVNSNGTVLETIRETTYKLPATTRTTPPLDQASALPGLRTISQPGKLDGIYASQTANRASFGRTNIDSLRGSRFVNRFLLTGLPALVLIMSALVLCLIFKVCRAHCDKSKRKSASSGSRSSRLQVVRPSLTNEPVDGREGPISLISGGKMIDGLKNIQALCKDGKSVDQGDIERLTPDMDDNSNDSDEQPAKRSSVAFWKGSKKRSQKFQGVGSGGESVVKSYGQIKYRIIYDFDSSTLAVSILEAKDLAVMDLNGFSDPYVRVYLMPDCKRKYEKTRVHKKTLNPIFDETFNFQVSYGELMSKTLVLAVYDFDRFSKHDEIGQISIPISSIDLARSVEEWRQLDSITDSSNDQLTTFTTDLGFLRHHHRPEFDVLFLPYPIQLGDLCVSLRYVPSAGKLTVVVLEARKLKKMDVAGLSDPYVKLVLMNQGKRVKKRKTSTKKCTLNPHYNEAFSFEIPFEQIQNVQLILTVVDYDRIGTSEPIGKIVLGCENTSGGSEVRHWMDMLASPRRPIAQWHSLKDIELLDITKNLGKASVD